MREIKFRIWRGAGWNLPNHMVYFSLDDLLFDEDYTDAKSGGDKLMQYTGLKDKNGKEIYEGDVCVRNGHRRVIVFENGAFMCYPQKHWHHEVDIDHISSIRNGWFLANFVSDIEVIGNLYENCDLLK